MTAMQIVFLVTAVVTLFAAFRTVTTPNLIHAALWLILALAGVAVFYALLNANFFAVIQVVVYIGAIAILMVFAIMLTRREMRDRGKQTSGRWWWAAILGAVFFAGVTWMIEAVALPSQPTAAVPASSIADLGKALVNPNGYVIPFEVASVLLLAALIGAVFVAWTRHNS